MNLKRIEKCWKFFEASEVNFWKNGQKKANFEAHLMDFVTNIKKIWIEFEMNISKESGFIGNLNQFKSIELRIQ